jgi:hypothetical protein
LNRFRIGLAPDFNRGRVAVVSLHTAVGLFGAVQHDKAHCRA